MKKAYKDYIYKGWNIRSSQHYNNWEVQPIFTGTEEQINSLYENFVNNEYSYKLTIFFIFIFYLI